VAGSTIIPSAQRFLSRERFSWRSSHAGAELFLLTAALDFRCKMRLSVKNPKSAILTLRLRCEAAGPSSSEERCVKSLSSSDAA
jgi:hypothetical protein